MFKPKQKIVIIGTDPDFGHHVVAEPQPGTNGSYIGLAPVEGKLHLRFKEADLGYTGRGSVDLFIKSELVGEIGTPFLPPPEPREPVVFEPTIIEHLPAEEVSDEARAEIAAIWAEALRRVNGDD